MPKSEAFAIATQQAYAADKAPSNYGTSEGKQKANKKYSKPSNDYEQTSDPKEKTSMNAKMHGHIPLADMISQAIEGARAKMASVVDVEETELSVVEATEKVASAEETINISSPEEIEKLAAALEQLGEKIKEADSVENGEESRQGGEQIPTNTQVGGKQPYKANKGKHQPPKSIGTKQIGDGGKSPTLIENDEHKAPGMHSPYPKKGVLKMSAAQSVMEQIKAKAQEKAEEATETVVEDKEKKSSAVDFLLGKIAATRFSKESPQGGMTLDSASEEGVPARPSNVANSDRHLITSAKSAVNYTKRDAKANEKKMLKEVLTEPAQTKSTDSKVQENLRNASKGGVKIAAEQARVYLAKIKEAGCSCDGKSECKFCKMKTAMDKSKA